MSGYPMPIRKPIGIPTDTRPDKDKKSGDASLTYRSGAGFLAAPHDVYPVAFKSLGDLLAYWEFHVFYHHWGGRPKTYSLNSVHPSTAICVSLAPDLYKGDLSLLPWILYTAPGAVQHAWYYL